MRNASTELFASLLHGKQARNIERLMSKSGKKVSRKPTPKETVVIEVSEDYYQREIKSGVEQEHALKPGQHMFQRGGFKARHPDFDSRSVAVKVQVRIHLDRDIVDHFKKRAKSNEAAGYETEINKALRSLIEAERALQPRLRSVG
jgi:uncharacterized protein (DUF4415 family)